MVNDVVSDLNERRPALADSMRRLRRIDHTPRPARGGVVATSLHLAPRKDVGSLASCRSLD